MAYSRKRARKYIRRVRRATRRFSRMGRKSTGIRAPYGSRGFFGPGYRRGGKSYIELKKFDSGDTALAGMAATQSFNLLAEVNDAAAQSVCIFSPPTGSGIFNRIGSRVMVRSIQIRGDIVPTNVNNTTRDFCRLICAVDMQANGTAGSPSNSDVLGNGASPANGYDARSFNNLNNRARFKILMDYKWTNFVGTQSELLAPGGGKVTLIDFYKKVNFPVTFNGGTTGLPADIQTGKIFIIAMGLQTNASAAGHTFQLTTRVRFVDP